MQTVHPSHPPGIIHCETGALKSSRMKSRYVAVSWSRGMVQFIPLKHKVFFFPFRAYKKA